MQACGIGEGIYSHRPEWLQVITNTVSVDYLSKPVEVFKEMHRVLKPGGKAIMSFSNRCFPTKGDRQMRRQEPSHHLFALHTSLPCQLNCPHT